MKTYSFILLIAALAIGGCSSAYRSTQTPDAVYYSPEQERSVYTSSDNNQTVIQGDNPDAGSYVVYDDGNNDYNDYYDDGYYSRRISMFDRPGSLYAFNNFYWNDPWYWNDPFMWNGLSSWNMGFAYNPFYRGYPSLALSWSWGSPWGRWYRPWGHYYSPWYSYGYSPYYSGGYWGGYGYGKNIILNPRPATSYGARRSVSSRAANGISSPRSSSGERANAPRRVFRSNNSDNNDNNVETARRPRRVFKAQPDEHPVRVNNNRTVETQRPTRRVFKSNSDNNRSYRPAQQNTRSINRPTRSFNSTPTRSSSSSRSFSAPARTSAPRGRR